MSTMTLFSWFIKANSHSTCKKMKKQGTLATSNTVEINNGLADELNTFNNNTMWPIAKVKTTTMIIKKPKIKVNIHQARIKEANTSLVIIPLSH